ncbi:MAG: DUF512 domain-containing protein [Thermodesulfovibrionales bacterium]|nr:DUF512 domain-containing protein [Thermodesulfovibrionales bacterium]
MSSSAPKGILVESVRDGSPSAQAGVLRGDRLLRVNGQRVEDLIDYMFNLEGPVAEMEVERGGKRDILEVELSHGEDAGLDLEHFKVRTCRNKCKFCFVSQLPKGLRRPLYIKDEDYRMSFLYGNFVTLAGLADRDRKRILRQHLSPLYVSVHSTDTKIRNELLGNPKAPDVMNELRNFAAHGIRFHAQIVLCPGYNDGQALKRTIRDLYTLHPSVMSVAVVPLGLTDHSRTGLRPVLKADAIKALDIVDAFARRSMRKHGEAFVYSADELYLKARRAFPVLSHYGDLPQYENGVGMVPLFRYEAKKITPHGTKLKHLTFTGTSFYPSLKRFTGKLKRGGMKIEAVPVTNDFFGSSVTVAGLLTGRDVARQLAPHSRGRDVLLVPDVVLREGHGVFLDDMDVEVLGRELGIRVKVIESCPEGLLEAME